MSRQTQAELEQAWARLRAEQLEPISHLAGLLGVTKETATRWGARGRVVCGRRVYLDALQRRDDRIWYSSREAIARFQAACREAECHLADAG